MPKEIKKKKNNRSFRPKYPVKDSLNIQNSSALSVLSQSPSSNFTPPENHNPISDSNQELEMVMGICRSVSSILDIDKLIPEIYKQIIRILPCDTFILATSDILQKIIRIEYLVDEGVVYPSEIIDIKDTYPLYERLKDGNPLLINRQPSISGEPDPKDSTLQTVSIGNKSRRAASLLYVPIKVDKETIGYLSIQSYQYNSYNEKHQRLLTSIAAQAAIALENARNLTKHKEYIQRLELMAKVSTFISSTLDLQERFKILLNLVKEALGGDVCIIRELSENNLNLLASTGVSQKNISFTLPTDDGITKIILSQKEPLYIEDAITHPELGQLLKNRYDHFTFRSYLGAPMIFQNEVKGVMEIYTTSTTKEFTTVDAQHLQIIANYAAVAIENACLFKEKERVAEKLLALESISETGLSYLSLQKLLQKLINQIVSITKANAGAILLIDESGKKLMVMTQSGYTDEIRKIQLKIGEGIAGKVILENKPIAVKNIFNDPRFILSPEAHIPIKATLGVPLRINNKVIGVAHIDSFTEKEFSSWEISLFEMIAARASMAIEYSILYKESQNRAESLLLLQEAMVRELGITAPEELYKSIVKIASGLVGADIVALLLKNEDQFTFTYRILMGDIDLSLEGKILILDKGGLGGWVIQNNKSLITNTFGEDSRVQNSLEKDFDVTSAIIAPLSQDNNAFGAIALYRKDHPYNSFDLQSLELFSNQASLSLKNSYLFIAIQNAEERYRNLFEHANDGIYVHDMTGKFVFCNEAILRLTGYSRNEFESMKIDDLIYKEKASPFTYPDLNQMTKSPTGKVSEFIFRRKDGTQLFVEINAQIIHKDGKPSAVQGILRDISDRKRKERQFLELLDITNYLRSTLQIDELLNRIMEGVEELIYPKTYHSVSLLMLDKNTQELVITATRGEFLETYLHPHLKVGKGLIGKIASTGQAILISDMTDTSLDMDNFIISKIGQKITSLIGVPLHVQENLMGVMVVTNMEKDVKERFCLEDLQIIEMMANHAAIALEKTQLYKNLQSQYLQTVQSLAQAVDLRDSYTMSHSNQTSIYAVSLGRELALPDNLIMQLELAGILHDVGKIGVPDSILLKPDKLTEDEYIEIKKHPILGAKILEPLPEMLEVSKLVLYHQERYDGSGYPSGLKAEEIPIGSRVLAVVDSYQAMISDRVYRKALTKEEAIQELIINSGVYFDPMVVKAFLKVIKKEKMIFHYE